MTVRFFFSAFFSAAEKLRQRLSRARRQFNDTLNGSSTDILYVYYIPVFDSLFFPILIAFPSHGTLCSEGLYYNKLPFVPFLMTHSPLVSPYSQQITSCSLADLLLSLSLDVYEQRGDKNGPSKKGKVSNGRRSHFLVSF